MWNDFVSALRHLAGDTKEETMEELTTKYGIVFKQKQKDAIDALLSGSDVIVNLPVGYGKSLIYQVMPYILKSVEKPSKVVVISPLTSIMADQVSKLSQFNFPANAIQLSQQCHVVGKENDNVIEECMHSDIIFSHPEALLMSDDGQGLLSALEGKVGVIVIDECHKVEDWGKDFRRSFKQLGTLRSFFPECPMACLSATMTADQLRSIPKALHMDHPTIISAPPEINNIYFELIVKPKGDDVFTLYENIYKHQVDMLLQQGDSFPVTLLFMPLEHMSNAMQYASSVFGNAHVDTSKYGCLYSKQDKAVTDCILADLQSESPRFRLVFTTSVVGMGFDPPAVEHVIHARPPRNLSNYFQEVGRAGRRGQQAVATLHYRNADVSANVQGLKEDIVTYCKGNVCLRECILDTFGFKRSADSPTGCRCCSVCKCLCHCPVCFPVDAV